MSEHNQKFKAGDVVRLKSAPSEKFRFLLYDVVPGCVWVRNSANEECLLSENGIEFDLKFKIGDKVNVSKYPFISPWEVVGTLSDGRYVLENRTGSGELYGVTAARESEIIPVGSCGAETTLKALQLAKEALDLAIERLQNVRH
jgi:hypothetical protein